MSYTYKQKKQASPAPKEGVPSSASSAAPEHRALLSEHEQLGHRVDLPEAIREKMENAFGADLSAVRLYESQAVEDAGANAVTQGNNIAFAPGMLDFSSYGVQALLGHELSHVVSHARGEVTGSGFLNDHALEARADREGAMAAAGQTVQMPYAAMSPVSAAPAAGPMQASKKSERIARLRAQNTDQMKLDNKSLLEHYSYDTRPGFGMLWPYELSSTAKSGRRWIELGTKNGEEYKADIDEWDRRTGNMMTEGDTHSVLARNSGNMQSIFDKTVAISNRHQSEFSGGVKDLWKNELNLDSDAYNGSTLFNHLSAAVNVGGDANTQAADRINQFQGMLDTVNSGDQTSQDEMMRNIKEKYRQYLLRLKNTHGTDIHKESVDALSKNNRYSDLKTDLSKYTNMPLMFATQYGTLFDKDNADDQEFLQLARYYSGAKMAIDRKVSGYLGEKLAKSPMDYNGMINDSKKKLGRIRR